MGGMRKYKESFYLQGILDNINEQEASFLDCKHKHMMKREPHLTNSESCTICLPREFYGFKAELILRV